MEECRCCDNCVHRIHKIDENDKDAYYCGLKISDPDDLLGFIDKDFSYARVSPNDTCNDHKF